MTGRDPLLRHSSHSFGLASRKEWEAWSKEGMRPPNVSSDPRKFYKHDGWQGWGHWLGTGNTKGNTKQFLPFDEALLVARSLRLISSAKWRAWCKSGARPANVPSNPDKVYVHDGWLGYEHWLWHPKSDSAPAPAPAHRPRKRAAAHHPGPPSKGRGSGKGQRW